MEREVGISGHDQAVVGSRGAGDLGIVPARGRGDEVVDRCLRRRVGREEIARFIPELEGDVSIDSVRGQQGGLARVQIELVKVAVTCGIDGPQHAGAVSGGGRSQAAKRLAQVIGRGDRAICGGARFEGCVEDRLECVVPGCAAGAGDHQRVGPRGRDRGGLEDGGAARAGCCCAGDGRTAGTEQSHHADQGRIGRKDERQRLAGRQ